MAHLKSLRPQKKLQRIMWEGRDQMWLDDDWDRYGFV
jgi:hypothetical protein